MTSSKGIFFITSDDFVGMCVAKMSIRDLEKSSVISSMSNELNAAAQLMLEIDERIASFSAFE